MKLYALRVYSPKGERGPLLDFAHGASRGDLRKAPERNGVRTPRLSDPAPFEFPGRGYVALLSGSHVITPIPLHGCFTASLKGVEGRPTKFPDHFPTTSL